MEVSAKGFHTQLKQHVQQLINNAFKYSVIIIANFEVLLRLAITTPKRFFSLSEAAV